MPRRLSELIGDVLGVDSSKITNETTQNDTEKWDSLNSLLIIDEIEKEFNVKIAIDEIIEINRVADIREILKKHNVDVE